MQPNFGTDIYSSLFEQNTTSLPSRLQTSLSSDIETWLPYITINAIDVNQDIDQYSVLIRLRFHVSTIGANLVINILASENELQISDAQPDPEFELVAVNTFRRG